MVQKTASTHLICTPFSKPAHISLSRPTCNPTRSSIVYQATSAAVTQSVDNSRENCVSNRTLVPFHSQSSPEESMRLIFQLGANVVVSSDAQVTSNTFNVSKTQPVHSVQNKTHTSRHTGAQINIQKISQPVQRTSSSNTKFPQQQARVTPKVAQVMPKPSCIVAVQTPKLLTPQDHDQKDDVNSRRDGEQSAEIHGRTGKTVPVNSSTAPYRVQRKETRMEIVKYILQDHNYGAPPPSPQLQAALIQHSRHSTAYALHSGAGSSLVAGSSSSIGPSYSQGFLLNVRKLKDVVVHDDDDYDDDETNSAISSGSEREIDPLGEETETAPEDEGNEEDSITRCVCNFQHDDGYMICCDRCFVWQHVDCMGIDRTNIPEEYLCEKCQPRRVDRHRARALQLRKREELLNSSTSGDSSTETTSDGDGDGAGEDDNDNDGDDDDDGRSGVGGGSSNDNAISNDDAVPNVTARRKRPLTSRRKTRSVSSNRNKGQVSSNESPVTVVVTRQRLRRDSTKEQPQQVSSGMQRRSSTAQNRRKEVPAKPAVSPENKRVSMRLKIIKSKNLDSDSDTPEIETMQQLRQWITHYEEAVTNHYSPELRARIASIRVNGVHSDLRPGSLNTGAVRCRVQQLSPSVRILVSTVQLSTNQPIIELRGKYMLSSQHKSPQSIAGHMKRARPPPGPFIFFYRLPKEGSEVCVDTRTYGNDARFVRRSCRPNAEIRHCIEKGTLHLYIVTTTNIEKNSEITISHDTLQDSEGNPTSCACGNAAECLALNPKKPTQEVSDREQRRRSRRTTSSEDGESSPATQQIQQNTSTAAPRRNVISIKLPTQKTEEPQPEKLSPASSSDVAQEPEKKRKLTREERKMEAIMKAFERLEKAEQRRQENQAKQAQKKDHDTVKKESRTRKERRERTKSKEKDSPKEKSELPQNMNKQGPEKPRRRRHSALVRRRKGRRRRSSSSQQQASLRQKHHTRLNSVSSNASSVDETAENPESNEVEQSAGAPESNVPDSTQAGGLSSAADLLLAFASASSPQHTDETCEQENLTQQEGTQSAPVTPQTQISSNPAMFGTVCDSGGSISSQGSTPPTNLSSACLLVAAAVGPLAPGFKFPKTKKVLMNEWLSKSPDPPAVPPLPSPPVPSDCPRSSAGLEPGINRLVQGPASAKKRWLRQAISEECDSPSPNSRPDSPPSQDYVTPLKKRRLARTSVSSERSFTPPTTPTMLADHHTADATKGVSQYDANCDNFRVSCDEDDTNASLEDSQSIHEEEEEEEDEEEEEEEEDQYGASGCEAQESELRPVQDSAVELTYSVNIEQNQSHVIKAAHPTVIRQQHNFGSYPQYAESEFAGLDKNFRNAEQKTNYVSQQDCEINCDSAPNEIISGEASKFTYKESRNEDYDDTGGCGSGAAGGSGEGDNEEEDEDVDIEEDEETEEAGDDDDDDDGDDGHNDDHDAAGGEDANDNGDEEDGDVGGYEAVSGEGQAGGRGGTSGTDVMDEEGEHEDNGIGNKKKEEEDEVSVRDDTDIDECAPAAKQTSSTSLFCNETRRERGILQTTHNYRVTSAECSVISSCKSAEGDEEHTRIINPCQSAQKSLEEQKTKQEERVNTVLVQPAKRKVRTLSISEYRQRKQHSGCGSEQGVIKKESTCCSPTIIRSRSSSTSSTSSVSHDEDDPQRNTIDSSPESAALPLIVNTESVDDKRGISDDVNYMRWNCAPTLVERERENLTARLRREFGLFRSEEEEQERARRQGLIQESNSDLKRKLLLPHPPPQIISHSDSVMPPNTLLSPPMVSVYSAAHKICPYSSDSGNYSSGLYTPTLHAPVVSGPAYSPLYSMKGQVYQPFTAGLHPKSSVATSPVKGKIGVLPAATFLESSESASVAHSISESQYLVRGTYSEPVIPQSSPKETTSHYVGHVAVTHTTSTANPQPFYSTASESYLKPSSHH
ncbi:uncharacterized protein LOC126297385 isoform X1 [Schistocerca gregaria]|uniref:uncharacterized protein LOC126297385 isoform X1 n=2 Tax=Schistocerca gregaria TaxID=7010 RepID=UPI00211E31B1|nr:uncharacterized protein LOC126297385 isoform X1 [Schistocerca gregaria]